MDPRTQAEYTTPAWTSPRSPQLRAETSQRLDPLLAGDDEVGRGARDRYRRIRGFLRAIYGGFLDEHALLSSYLVVRGRREGLSFWTKSIEVASSIALRLAERGDDADYHVALHDIELRREAEGGQEELDSYRGAVVTRYRGLSATAAVLFGLWIDIDYGKIGHQNKNLPPDRKAAWDIVARLELDLGQRCSLIVDSGGGFHVYLLFREPWTFETNADRSQARQLCRALQRRAGIIAADIGRDRTGIAWELDTTSDLARVLRVAGTRNYKADPREVRIVERSSVRWNPSDLCEHPAIATLLDDPSVVEPSIQQARTTRPSQEELRAVRRKLAKELRANPFLARTWRHQRDDEIACHQRRQARPIDTSVSVYDFHLAVEALRLGWTDQETRSVLQLHQERQDRPVGAKREQYFQRTIGRARRLLYDDTPWAPDAPAPTRPIIRTIDDLEVVRQIALGWTPGGQSLSVCGWPGMGKTSSFGRAAIEGLSSRAAGWEGGVAVLVLPTRGLVQEKVDALRGYGAQRNVRVMAFLGRSPQPDSGWYCEQAADHRLRAELHRPGCKGCPSWASCSSTQGRYILELGEVLQAVEKAPDASAVLLVTTGDLVKWSWGKIPDDAPIILDDAGPRFGIVREVALRHIDLVSACENLEAWMEANLQERGTTLTALIGDEAAGRSRRNLDLVLAADLVRKVVSAVQSPQSGGLGEAALSQRILELPEEYRAALLSDRVQPALFWDGNVLVWPWEAISPEDGLDQRPAFTKFALDLARAVLRERPPEVCRSGRQERAQGGAEFHVLMADEQLIARARAGRVAWLGVGPMPAMVLASLGARQEVLVAEPRGLRVIVCLVPTIHDSVRSRYLSFGPAQKGREPRGDEITRALFRALNDKIAGGPLLLGGSEKRRLGAILRKADYEDLGRPTSVGYYGRDHAGTDDFEDRDLLIVRRHVPPLDVARLDAAAIRSALGIRRIERFADAERAPARGGGQGLPAGTCRERRRWEGSNVDCVTVGLFDPLERELQRYYELHHQLNAIGRCRPLTSEGESVVLLLAGVPFDWVRPELRNLEELLTEIGVEIILPDPDARKAALEEHHRQKQLEASRRRSELAKILREEGPASHRSLSTRLGVSPATISRDLAALGQDSEHLLDLASLIRPSLYRFLEEQVNRNGHVPPALCPREVVDEVQRYDSTRLSERTVRRRMREIRQAVSSGAPLVPRRSDSARSLRLTIEAMERLAARSEVEA